MPNQDIRDYIQRFIGIRASEENIESGKEIYNYGNVQLTYKNKIADAWHFSVEEDGKKHTVIAKNLQAKDLNISCTCAFKWGSICSHAVACLMFISDEEEGASIRAQNDESNRANLRTALGYRLDDYSYISLDDIADHTSRSIANEILHSPQEIYPGIVKIKKGDIVFHFNDYNRDVEVRILYRNEKVYISSGANIGTPKLNRIEAFTLKMIALSPNPDLFHIVFDKGLESKEKEVLLSYGFDEDVNFKDFFFHGFSRERGLYVSPKSDQMGILPVKETFKHPFMIFVENVNNEVVNLENIPRANKERMMGFVIELPDDATPDVDDYDFYEQNFDLEVYPIVGKPNKSHSFLNSNFEKYDEFNPEHRVQITSNAEKVLEGIKVFDESDDGKKEYLSLRHLMHLLSNERFVYVKRGGDFKLKKSDLQQVSVSKKLIEAKYQAFEDDFFVGLRLNMQIGDKILSPEEFSQEEKERFLYLKGDKIYVPQTYSVAEHIISWDQEVKMVKAHKDNFIREVIFPLSRNFEVDLNGIIDNLDKLELDFRKKQVYLSEQFDYLIITPQVEYQHGVSVMLSHAGNVLVETEEGISEYVRNFDLEDDFIQSLAALHPAFEDQVDDKRFYIHYDDFTKDMWFYRFFDEMQNQEVEVFGLKDLKNFKYSPFQGKVSTAITSGQDWFEVDVKIMFGDTSIGLKDIKKAILNQQKYVQLKDGSVGLLPKEWFHKLEKYFRHGEIVGDKLAVSKLRFGIIDELFDNISDEAVLNEIAEKRQRMAQFTEITKTEVPQEITADLRSYQKEGLNWLNFLDEMGWGGILADDMGLGKTLQVLTFLQHLVKKDTKPNLVVVPTTLLFNWENELKKFAPELKAYYHYGVNRERENFVFEDYNIVFTSYGVLLRDVEFLSQFSFNYLILDESQAIKNPSSRRFKAVNLIKAKNRIALSGTPIENSTFDLYAQMTFVNRGIFGSMGSFKQNFSNAIDKEGNENIAAELQRMINPFILRRTKERVANELPPKTEDVIYCEMDRDQRKVYDAYRNEFREKLLGRIEQDGIGKSKLMVLEGLTRLRQICDSPLLLNDDTIGTSESVKINEIVQHITDKTAKHKILVFSQFVKMLGLVKAELSKRNIEFEYLDGQSSTIQREKSVNNFQDNSNLRVFLISLKAGGTGLNLTAADYVYLLDPWWNPAVENQAIDRCYRIGQDKKVFAYRMICKNTVEEKILQLQGKKKKIAGEIVQTDENMMKNLDAEDIRSLFS